MERALIRQEISKACKRLALTQQVVTMCELEATPRQEEFLYQVLSQELAHRERLRRERLLERAAFPVRKTLDDYEWTALRLPAALPAEDVTSCNFVRMKRNLILYGPVGTGKTHLAIALGVAACEAGLETRFFTAASLATKLDEARRSGNLEKLLQSIDRAELVILDEWGYLPLEKEQAQLLFQLISSCYERRSLIITTNLEFSKWGTIFTDDQMAAAMIDRLAHHGHLLTFEGQSYRLRNALMRVE